MGRREPCWSCGHSNPPGSSFCGQCGGSLAAELECASCGAENPAGQRFCNRCGSALAAEAEESASPAEGLLPPTPDHLAAKIRAGRASLEGERKQVTVLFADLAGSMGLAEQTDPETWRLVMQGFFTTLCEGIHHFEGTVDKFTGDGVMALFGAPVAHEDHARRACHAALHLQEQLAAYASEVRRTDGLEISTRVGLNSGEVVVGGIGEDLAMDYTAVGHTVGLAQRMESLAEPGKAYLTEHTARLVEGFMDLSDLGEFEVKGASHPLRVFELSGTGPARGHLDVARARGLSGFLGREEEVETLGRALGRARDGEGAVVGIVGEAGVGKSRLCLEFAERCRARGIPVYQTSGQAHTTSVPLHPVLQLLRDYFEITDQLTDQAARERVAGKLLSLDPGFAEDLPLLFDFLAVPDPERPPPRMDPEARRRQLHSLVRRLVHAQSAHEPGLTLIEDLHWIDPASELFLASLIDAVAGTRNLTVVNFRPEYRAEWMSKSYYRQIALPPLGPEATTRMLTALVGDDPSLEAVKELIRERTAGNPFFIEEVVRSLVEDGSLVGGPGAYEAASPVSEVSVPASVEAVLAARIDRLAEADKELLQAAAVIGKEFSGRVLERAAGLEATAIEVSLRNLVASEFVQEQELHPEALYAFRHPLTREVAYQSQLAEHRAATHARVAKAIADLHPDRLDERSALMAEHWEAAGDQLEAARWHARAAAWAGNNDPTEALRHSRRMQEIADRLPETDEATALRLTSRLFILRFGWRVGVSIEEAEAIFAEADRIATRSGDIRSRAMLLISYATIRGTGHGDVREHVELTRRAMGLTEEAGDPALHLVAICGSAPPLWIGGELEECVATVDRGIELAGGDPTLGAGVGIACPLALCHSLRGVALTYMGRLAEGEASLDQGARLAQAHDDVSTLGWSFMWRTWVDFFRGDHAAQLAHAHRAFELADRLGDSFSRTVIGLHMGFAQIEAGRHREAVDVLEQAQAIARESRTSADSEPYRLGSLAEALAEIGEPERALRLAREATEVGRERGQRNGEAFACRSLARILLSSSGPGALEEAEAATDRGLELAPAFPMIVPLLRVERAEVTRRQGDEKRRHRELTEAHRLFVEMGAPLRAERVAAELEAPAAG